MLAIGPLLVIVTTIGVIYSVAATSLGGRVPGLVAAVAAVLSPLLWTLFSSAPSTLYPLPFIGAWLMSLALLWTTRRPWWAVVAGLSLGAGLYMSLAAVVMMPCYVALTVVFALMSNALSRRDLAVFVGAFLIAAVPLAGWWAMHPAEVRQIINAHHLYDADRFNMLQGAREVTSWVGLTARSEVFWDYLNPAFLFVTGRVLTWPLAVLLPIGLYYAIIRDATWLERLMAAGYFIAPAAASLTAEAPTAGRIAFIIPFAALVSAIGVARLPFVASRLRPR
jgi:hypothetical protein